MLLFQGKKIKVNVIFGNSKSTYEISPHQSIQYIKNTFLNEHPWLSLPFNLSLPNSETILTEEDDQLYISEISKGKSELTFTITKPQTHTHSEPNKIKRCQCTDTEINSYCLICKKYLCSNCKNKCQTHKIIAINPLNIEESIKIYSNSLNDDIKKETLNLSKSFLLFKNFTYEKIQKWKDSIIKRMDSIENCILKFYEFNKEINERFKMKSKFNEEIAFRLNKKIQKIENDLSNKQLNLNNAVKYFDMLRKINDEISESILSNSSTQINENYILFGNYIKEINKEINFVNDSVNNVLEKITAIYNSFKLKYKNNPDKDNKEMLFNHFIYSMRKNNNSQKSVNLLGTIGNKKEKASLLMLSGDDISKNLGTEGNQSMNNSKKNIRDDNLKLLHSNSTRRSNIKSFSTLPQINLRKIRKIAK